MKTLVVLFAVAVMFGFGGFGAGVAFAAPHASIVAGGIVPQVLPAEMALFGKVGDSCPFKKYQGQMTEDGVVFDITEYITKLCPRAFQYAGFVGAGGWYWIGVPNGQYRGDIEVTQEFQDQPQAQQIKIWPNDGRFSGKPPLIILEPQSKTKLEVVRVDNFHFLVRVLEQPPSPPPPGPPPGKNLACLLASKNSPPKLFDGEEILIAIRLWVAEDFVPGTRQIITDEEMLGMIEAWFDNRPCDQIPVRRNSVRARGTLSGLVVQAQQGPDSVTFTSSLLAPVTIQVFSLSGQPVFQGQSFSGTLNWPEVNQEGFPVANGVYLYTVSIRTPNGIVSSGVRKLAILR